MSDLVEKQAAIDWLKSEWDGMVTSVFKGIENLPSVQTTQNNRVNSDIALDLIERQAAIDELRKYIAANKNPNHDARIWEEGMNCALAVIGALPSAQPERTDKEKYILDATCGNRTIWFQKNEPHTVYCDIRREEWDGYFGKTLNTNGKKKRRHIVINPDILCSFTDLPFQDNTFNLVVFDPPHVEELSEKSWLRKQYGSLDGDWKPMIRDGFRECMRVLCNGGVLIFKWSDISIRTRDILKVIGRDPLFGHRSGKKMNTHWMCFMKFEEKVEEHETD